MAWRGRTDMAEPRAASRPAASGLVSVVIPARNAAATLAVQLQALATQVSTRPFEVIVADNGSTDDTAALVASHRDRVPGLRLVDAGAAPGTNAARNAGTREAGGDLVLLCDADDRVGPGWVEALARGLETADAVGGRLDRVPLNAGFIDRWGPPTGALGIATHLDFLRRPIGANAGFRREVWCALGGFDERYVRGGTETEFYWRLQLRGYTLAAVDEAVVAYRMRSTFRALVRQMYVWGHQSPMLYRDFRAAGMRWQPMATLRAWRHTARLLRPALRTPADRLRLARHLAYLSGRVVGSIRYRTVFL